jgi:hypothetical protein
MSTPSLLNIPYLYKAGTLYSQIPESGAGDFSVSRTTTVANRSTRINKDGFIETVLDNVPRLDYPVGGAVNGCPALLVEPSGTNLARQSENFGATWSLANLLSFGSGSVLNTTATLDPYGTNVSDLIVADATLGQHGTDQTITHSSGGYVFSVFLKQAGYGFGRLRIGLDGATFDLVNGTISATDVGIVSSIQSYGNGWYRCIVSKAVSAANEVIRINMQTSAIGGNFQGDGTSGIYVFGAQYETGSVATSYIPTTTAAVTRSAEVISDTTATALIGQTEGTIYWEGAISRIDRVLFSLAQGTSTTNCIYLQTLSNGFFRADASVNGSATCAILSLATATLGQFYKIAFAYKENDFALYINGVLQGSDNLGALPTGLSNAIFARGDSSLITDQRCRNIAIYPNRIPNTAAPGVLSLATLTAP